MCVCSRSKQFKYRDESLFFVQLMRVDTSFHCQLSSGGRCFARYAADSAASSTTITTTRTVSNSRAASTTRTEVTCGSCCCLVIGFQRYCNTVFMIMGKVSFAMSTATPAMKKATPVSFVAPSMQIFRRYSIRVLTRDHCVVAVIMIIMQMMSPTFFFIFCEKVSSATTTSERIHSHINSRSPHFINDNAPIKIIAFIPW